MTDLATLRTWLSDAETAYHTLQIGGKAQELQHGQRRIIYTPADAMKLKSYIAELRSDIAALEGTARRRPIYLGLRP